VEELLIRLIRKQKGDNARISLAATLEELEYESFSFIELVLSIEEQLGIEFEDRYLGYREFDTVGDVLAYTEFRVAALERRDTRG
jgi:acyl carrier protein